MNSREKFIKGLVQSVEDGVHAGSRMVEAMHEAVLDSVRRHNPFARRAPVLTRTVYRTVRGVASLVGMGGVRAMEWACGFAQEEDDYRRALKPWQLHWVSGFNAAWGDFFEEEEHPWAIPMGFARGDDPALFTPAFPHWLPADPSPHLVIFIHGLGMNELAWRRGRNPGFAHTLAEATGCQVLMLRYNTGLPIHHNGETLAYKLEQLVEDYPVPLQGITLVGHSMGGLVALSASHYGRQADHRWTSRLQGMACLGSPHQGANLEVAGNWFTHLLSQTRYSAPLSLIGKRRSAGIKDLRHGSVRAEDWEGRDRDHVERFHPHPVAMLPGAGYLLVASTLPRARRGVLERTVGDGLVTPDSALNPQLTNINEQCLDRVRLDGISHLGLLTHPRVGEALSTWYKNRCIKC